MILRSSLSLLLAAFGALAQQPTLRSPNGDLVIAFDAAGGKLTYSVAFRGKALIESSALRLEFQGRSPLGSAVRVVNTATSSADETYRLITGKTSSVRDRYNALRVDLEESGVPGRKLSMEARAYNDGVAFCYVVPDQPPFHDFRLSKEGTEFRLSKDAMSWALILPNFLSMYESEFVKLPLSAFSNQGGVKSNVLLGCPLLLEVPGVAWAAITEADLRDTSSMYLTNPSGNWQGHWLESQLAPDHAEPEVAVTGTLPWHSAWRVLIVGDQPGRLVESNLLTNLNPPQAFSDTSWIKAGKAAWDWWSGSIGADGKGAFTTATMKYYVDFAAASGFEFMQVDAGWSPIGDITKMNGRVDIPELVKYAAAKGVKIWIWLHWAAVDKQLEEAFALYERWGVAGVKIDFMSRDDQRMMKFYYRVAEAGARHHIMVDYHGATKPSGLDRTYPNVMGYEAVLGLEQSKAGMRDNPDHHVTLPFTRMLTGRMDYTPGGFDNATKADFAARMTRPMVQGTRAHQLAMYAVYEAPFQMVSDQPAAYKDQPAFEFLKSVPATWDETHVLSGEPGEYVAMARRHGKEWFLGAMTNWSAREMDVPLSFLGGGKWRAEIYADADDADRLPKNVSITRRTVESSTRLHVKMAPGGGIAVRFVPE